MNKKGIGLIILGIMFGVTFWFSSKDGSNSTGQAIFVLERLRILDLFNIEKSTPEYLKLINSFKSLAHFFLYIFIGIGGYLFSGSIRKAIVIAVLIASVDELHQYYVPGREMDIRDVVVDTFGALSGILIVKYAQLIKNRICSTGKDKAEERSLVEDKTYSS